MNYQLNTQSIKKLDRALKVINQRIAEYAKPEQFGRGSAVYKNAIAPFDVDALQSFIGTSKSGNFKFDIKAINRALRSGEPHPELESVLNVAGYTYGKPGFLRQTKEGKMIKTVSQLKNEWRETLDPVHNKTERELKDEISVATELAEDFKSLIYEYQETFGDDVAKDKFPNLYGKGRGELSKSEYRKIRDGMIRDIVQTKLEHREIVASFVDSFAYK